MSSVSLRPAGHVLDVAGVDYPALGGVFQQVKRRLPVGGGGLHHAQGHALGSTSQSCSSSSDRVVAAYMRTSCRRGPRLGLARHPHARHQRRLADVQRGHPRHQLDRLLGDLLHLIRPSANLDSGGCPREPAGTARRNRVLTATMQDPGGGSQRPD